MIRETDPTCATATLVAALTRALSVVREPRLVRARFEHEVRVLLNAISIALRDDRDGVVDRPGLVLLDVPGPPYELPQRLEVVFEPGRQIDGRTRRLLASAAAIAGLLIEIELAKWPLAAGVRAGAPGRRRAADWIEPGDSTGEGASRRSP